MNLQEITDITDPRVAVYSSLTDRQLQHTKEWNEGIFIAESPKVIQVALNHGYKPVSLLCEKKHIDGDAAPVIRQLEEGTPIYTGRREVLAALTGYTLTRGVLCAMTRKQKVELDDVVLNKHRIAVIDDVCDATNIGSIFRAAAALGVDGIVLSPTSCDPFNRRSIRVSMGTVFVIPWCRSEQPVLELKARGYKTLAFALKPYSIPLDTPSLSLEPRLAMIFGAEGEGLKDEVIGQADHSVIIPMSNGVDSLNVAAAASVVFWQLRWPPQDGR